MSATRLLRLCILALPLAGLLIVVGEIGSLNQPDPDVDPQAAALAVSTTAYFVTQFLGNILGLTLLIFGVIALFFYLMNARGGSWASLALVCSILGIALVLSVFGIMTYALPVFGTSYLAGQQDVIALSDALFNSTPFGVLFIVVFLFYSAGSILFGIAVWRSEELPKWAGVLYAIHGPLLSGPLPDPASLLGALLLVLAGGWIALGILRQPSVSAESEASPIGP